uniref:5-hydroxyisourate hydrolase n=2 Tax=Lepisosteus oculatus TaxID=7918 RepID=W5M0G9_LEPOC
RGATRLRLLGDHLQTEAQLVGMDRPPGSPLTTHVLDTARGVPAARLPLGLYRLDSGAAGWTLVTSGATNDDGRCPGLITRDAFLSGMYKMRFETGQYWAGLGETGFYPYVEVVFSITDPSQKYHVPLLLSPFSYSTYRGS